MDGLFKTKVITVIKSLDLPYLKKRKEVYLNYK